MQLAALILFFVATPTASEQARSIFEKGAAEFSAGEFKLALESFNQAYALEPASGLLYNIGQCHRALHEWRSASTFFRLYSKSKPTKMAGDVDALIAEADAHAKLEADEQANAPAPSSTEPPPPATRTTAAPFAAVTETTSPPVRGSSRAPWILVGVGSGLTGVGAVLGILALTGAQSLNASQSMSGGTTVFNVTRSQFEGQQSQINTLASVSLSLLVGGAASVVSGLIWGLEARSQTTGSPSSIDD